MVSEDITTRIATTSDLEPLVHVFSLFREHLAHVRPTVEELSVGLNRLLADPDTAFLVAVATDGTFVGFAQLRFRFSAWVMREAAEIEDLYVIKAAQRSGVGRRLVSFAIDCARNRGCQIIGLNTNEGNTAALSLYRAFGFNSERPLWNGGRQLWLTKTLTL